jgi:hypothetical protein
MRIILSTVIALFATSAVAALPPPTEEEKAQAAEVAAKNAWSAKVGAYQLCKSTDRIAAKYRAKLKANGESAPAPVNTAACTDPGPYQSPIEAATRSKPLEAAESHSPAETAVTPPNSKANEAETKSGQGH